MPALPGNVSEAWETREGPIVLTTVDNNGNPNSIYAGCVKKYAEDKLVVVDNFFDKTRANILAGSRGVVLFLTKDRKAFQVKGSVDYENSGPIFDDMKEWIDPKLPGLAVAVVNVEEVFSGADKLL